jgi:hypothetical protein
MESQVQKETVDLQVNLVYQDQAANLDYLGFLAEMDYQD